MAKGTERWAAKKFVKIALVGVQLASPTVAMRYYLMSQWYDGGSHFCKYSNGTVLNIGHRPNTFCASWIEGE